jgi:hypothetical protein
LALFATSPVCSHSSAKAPRPPLRSVIRFSRPLDVFLRTRAGELISSRCHVQDSLPFRGFSPRAALPPSSEGRAPLPLLLDQPHRLAPAASDRDLGFEAFIRARPRSMQSRYSQLYVPLPSSGSSPPGSVFSRLDAAYPRPPLTTFLRHAFAFAIARRPRPQRLSRKKPALRLRAANACSRFRAFFPNLRARDPESPPVALR